MSEILDNRQAFVNMSGTVMQYLKKFEFRTLIQINFISHQLLI